MNTKYTGSTLPEASILLNWPAIDETEFVIGFLKSGIPSYQMDRITNGHMKRDIQVADAHPIAIAEAMSEKIGDFQSRLPLIGVEQVHVSPDSLILGANQSQAYEVSEEFVARIEAIRPDNRMYPPELPQLLRSMLAEKAKNGEKLYVYMNSVVERTAIQISAWSASAESNRYIKKMLKSLMIEFYRGIQKYGVKPEAYSMTPNLYNFDYGEILYGCEMEIPLLMQNVNYLIDISLTELKHFDIGIYDSQASLYDAQHVAWFTVAGAQDRLRFGDEEVELSPR